MEKINEMLIGVCILIGGFITKRLYSRNDSLNERICALEKVVVRKEDLHPLERNVDIILTHVLRNKNQ